jgi:hypothetical protein
LRMGNVLALLDGGNRLRETSIYIIHRGRFSSRGHLIATKVNLF